MRNNTHSVSLTNSFRDRLPVAAALAGAAAVVPRRRADSFLAAVVLVITTEKMLLSTTVAAVVTLPVRRNIIVDNIVGRDMVVLFVLVMQVSERGEEVMISRREFYGLLNFWCC